MPTMQRNPYGGVIDPRNMGARGAGIIKPPTGMPAFQEGGFVDDEGLEDQGYDDAMLDPMAYVSSALSYGKKKYGIEPADQGEMGFQEGGVVPTQDEQAQGNPNAIDPRQAMAYLAGDGAVSPEIAQALEQRVDPQGQLDPTQRAMAAIGVAPNDEARFGLIQHYRTKYNGFAGAAKAALARGDMGEAAHQASLAMASVPNGQRTQFAPAQGGLAMLDQPAFGGGGGGRPQAPPQQSFQDGGEVEDDEIEDEILAAEYYAAGPDPVDAASEHDTAAPVTANWRPQVGIRPEPGVVAALENEDAGEDAPAQAAPGARMEDEEDPTVPPVREAPAGAVQPEQMDYSDRVTDEATMPDVAPAAPQVLPAQAIVKLLDEGFDAKLETAGSGHVTNSARTGYTRQGLIPETEPALERQGVIDTMRGWFGGGAGAPDTAPAKVQQVPMANVMSLRPEPTVPRGRSAAAAAAAAAIGVNPISPEEPISDTAPTLPPAPAAAPAATAPAAAPVTAPVTPPVTGRNPISPEEPISGTAPTLPPAPAAAPAAAAPARRPTASAAPPAGAVIDENRWDPVNRRMRPAVPGAFATREAAIRAGTTVPLGPSAVGASAEGAVPRGGALPQIRYGSPPAPQGVVPTNDPYERMLAKVRARGQYAEYDPNRRYPDPRTGFDPRSYGRNPNGRTASMGPGVPGTEPDIRRGASTYHPSGYDPNGAPAYGTRRVPGFGPGFREQTGDPEFMDPNFRRQGPQQVYGTNTGRGRISAGEAVRARTAQPDEGAPPGDRYGPGVPAVAPDAARRGNRLPTAGDARGQGGAGVIPTGGDQYAQAESPEERADRISANAYPAASQQRERQAMYERLLGEAEKRQTEYGKVNIQGQTARDVATITAGRHAAGETARMERQIRADEAKEEREDKRNASRLAEIDRKAEHAATAAEKKAGETARREVVRATMDGLKSSSSVRAGIIKKIMDTNPGKSPFELEELLKPHMKSFNFSESDALDAAKSLMGINPHTGVYGGGGAGGAAMRPPDSTGAAANRDLQPGAVAYKLYNGVNYKYIVGPDGNWYDEAEYQKNFGRK